MPDPIRIPAVSQDAVTSKTDVLKTSIDDHSSALIAHQAALGALDAHASHVDQQLDALRRAHQWLRVAALGQLLTTVALVIAVVTH